MSLFDFLKIISLCLYYFLVLLILLWLLIIYFHFFFWRNELFSSRRKPSFAILLFIQLNFLLLLFILILFLHFFNGNIKLRILFFLFSYCFFLSTFFNIFLRVIVFCCSFFFFFFFIFIFSKFLMISAKLFFWLVHYLPRWLFFVCNISIQ